ncbi:MAG: alpha/beta hydrolase-fold protein, partial [Bacteroidota bacterium]
MKKLFFLLLITGLLSCQTAIEEKNTIKVSTSLAKVDSILVLSKSMDKEFPASIVLPKAYQKDSSRRFPTVYLLHGYSGRHTSWVDQVPELTAWADLFELIIVLPDGDYNSWYLDSPIKEQHQFATFTGLELPNFIDQNFRTIAQREARAITGLSMGGHGAMYLATQYPDQFGAVGSMSGGLDLRPF